MANESNQGRKRSCDESLDKINTLPGEVINKILMYLPIRDAVGTSRLSRNWRYRWLSIPELVFDDRSTLQYQNFDKWVKFINNVLFLNDGKITRFEVKKFSDSASLDMDRWLLMLSRRQLNHLSIHFVWPTSYMCPSTLFCCQYLTTLSLESCGLNLPLESQFNGFKNLTTLRLVHGTVNKETLEFLVNSSPLLEKLVISPWKSILPHLSISALNLKTCFIIGKCEGITFLRTPKLQCINIKTWLHGDVARCKLDGILGGLNQLQEARITCPFIEFLSIDNFLEILQITYNDLKYVHLEIDFEDPKQILAALWLFRSSPSLKKIDIKVQPGRLNKGVYDKDICLDEIYEILEEAVLHSIVNFNLEGFGGSEIELRFIQFFLLNARVLQTIKIKWKENCTERLIKVRALLKLMEFKRTSSRLKVELPGWEEIICNMLL